jgi:hypothetical protein
MSYGEEGACPLQRRQLGDGVGVLGRRTEQLGEVVAHALGGLQRVLSGGQHPGRHCRGGSRGGCGSSHGLDLGGGEGEASSICVLSAPLRCFRVSSVIGDHPMSDDFIRWSVNGNLEPRERSDSIT